MNDYDNWKLDNPYDDAIWNCEMCDWESEDEDDFLETEYKDADGDKQCKFLCESCRYELGV